MSSHSLGLVSSIMSNIDEVKDKLTDGEYLTLCNLLKSLNDELKNPSRRQYDDYEGRGAGEGTEEGTGEGTGEGTEEGTEEGTDDVLPFNDTSRNLSERIRSFFESHNFYQDNEANPEFSLEEVMELFKNFLLNIHDEEEEDENLNSWFSCSCGCSVRFADIPEHLESENHKENFNIEV